MNKVFDFSKSEAGTLDVSMYGVLYGDWFPGSEEDALIAAIKGCLPTDKINVHINSEGGDMFAGIAVRNLLAAHPGEVTCIVEGLAASAASIVAMAGKTVMGRGSMLMIHNPWTIALGGAEDLRATADMLDKAQGALVSIYEAKTGKSGDELKGLLNAETWMTADEALEAGFADELADEGEEPTVEDVVVVASDRFAGVRNEHRIKFNGVLFPRDRVPARILAMAKTPGPAPVSAVDALQSAAPAAVLAIVPPAAPEPPLARAELARRAPELLAALVDEGRAAGVAAERARLQAIDELGLKGCLELIAAAKYGETPMDAPTLAVAAIKAGHQAGAELLSARRVESRVLAGVVAGAPDQAAAASARIIQAIADGGNARRGGTVR